MSLAKQRRVQDEACILRVDSLTSAGIHVRNDGEVDAWVAVNAVHVLTLEPGAIQTLVLSPGENTITASGIVRVILP